MVCQEAEEKAEINDIILPCSILSFHLRNSSILTAYTGKGQTEHWGRGEANMHQHRFRTEFQGT